MAVDAGRTHTDAIQLEPFTASMIMNDSAGCREMSNESR